MRWGASADIKPKRYAHNCELPQREEGNLAPVCVNHHLHLLLYDKLAVVAVHMREECCS